MMSEPTWVGLGGFIASAFSAGAAYLAIRQTIIQRKIANKVQLITKNVKVNLNNIQSGNSIEINKFAEEFKVPLPVINVGLGPAIKIEYEWMFDYEKSFKNNGIMKSNEKDPNKNLDELNSGNYIYRYLNLGTKFITIISKDKGSWDFKTGVYKDIDYILPWSAHKEEIEFKVPSLMLILLTRECLGYDNNIIDMFQIIQGPILVVRYEDITGGKTTRFYRSEFSNTNVKVANCNFDVELTLTLAPVQSKTAVILERIRKRYADIFWK